MEVDTSTPKRNEDVEDKILKGKELEKGQKQQEGKESKEKAKSEQEKAPVEALAPQRQYLKPKTRRMLQTLAEKEEKSRELRIFTIRKEYLDHIFPE